MTEHCRANQHGGNLQRPCGVAPPVDIRTGSRRLWLDPATDEWVLEFDDVGHTVVRGTKEQIEAALDYADNAKQVLEVLDTCKAFQCGSGYFGCKLGPVAQVVTDTADRKQ